jgi:hypothetical protein
MKTLFRVNQPHRQAGRRRQDQNQNKSAQWPRTFWIRIAQEAQVKNSFEQSPIIRREAKRSRLVNECNDNKRVGQFSPLA